MIDAIATRVRGGPQTDALWDFFIGGFFWWKTWVNVVVTLTPLIIGWALLGFVSGFWSVFGAVMAASLFYESNWEVKINRGESS